jgi:formylglycine-generating enzyme required for sulfatase activity
MTEAATDAALTMIGCRSALMIALLVLAPCALRGAAAADDAPAPAAAFRDSLSDGGACSQCPELVTIPAGRFTMGATADEEERTRVEWEYRGRSLPLTAVRITRPFALGRTPVTRGQFAAFASATGYPTQRGCLRPFWPRGELARDRDASWRSPGIAQNDDHPVVCVSWGDAQAYVRWLTTLTGESYRLPSEAEWEYAARAGTTTARWWGDDVGRGNASCADCASPWSERSTAPVGSFRANPFGLHDVLGNAWQWLEDCWNETLDDRPDDERAVLTGDCSARALRGGSWLDGAFVSRSSFRLGRPGNDRMASIGFRVARELRPIVRAEGGSGQGIE